MIKSKHLVLYMVLFCFMSAPALKAQQILKTAVEVISASDDMVGKRLVYNIKEMIRKSYSFRLTYDDEPRLQIYIVTVAYSDEKSSVATVYAVTWTLDGTLWHEGETPIVHPLYLTSIVGRVGSDHVESSAESIVARTDELAEEYHYIFD